MTISIAMATFNGEKYLREQLESFARQTVLPRELVVCDDCSSDSTACIIDKFATSAPFPVHFHRNDFRLGYADNFFKAAKLCKGSWIAFSDQDDVWLPNKLATVDSVIKRYERDDLMLVGHTSLIANERLELTGRRWPHFLRDSRITIRGKQPFCCIFGFSIVFKSVLVNLFDPGLRPYIRSTNKQTGHDNWISILANALGSSYHIRAPLAIWRRHGLATTTAEDIESHVQSNSFVRVKLAMSALQSGPYRLESENVNCLSGVFRELAENTLEAKWRNALIWAADDLASLSKYFAARADLYERTTFGERTEMLRNLFCAGAYFGPPFNKLGWRSWVKDCVFTFGLLRT
jgi:glycosyltransferase involved in cell wall biosynthesis